MRALGSAQYYRSSYLPWIEVARVRGSRHSFPKHYHDQSYTVGLIDKGASFCLGKNADNLALQGSTVLINPGQIHTGMPASDADLDYRMIYFDRKILHRMINDCRECDTDPEFSQFISDDKDLRSSLDQLAESVIGLEEARVHDVLEKECSLYTVLMNLSRFCSFSGDKDKISRSDEKISKLKIILSSDLEKQVSLESVSGRLGISRFQLLRLFKKQYGITPHVYRTLCRVDKAARLLRDGKSLIYTAVESGFADQSHFSRTFKNFYGATPGQYARCLTD
ncbi:MAG: AraC family transcriptional regulator [Spirochaetales bacterium]|nr:AraC family transcriptional regulator [Spirochaetales bacterium]